MTISPPCRHYYTENILSNNHLKFSDICASFKKVYNTIQMIMKNLTIDPSNPQAPTRDLPSGKEVPTSLPDAKETKLHPSNDGGENASLLFVGTATTILYVYFLGMDVVLL